MSFESAKTVTPRSFASDFAFARRPAVRYPVAAPARQSVNISPETRSKNALRKLKAPYAPRQSYDSRGNFGSGPTIGCFLQTSA